MPGKTPRWGWDDPFGALDMLSSLWSSTGLPSVSVGAAAPYRTLFTTLQRLLVDREMTVRVDRHDVALTVTEFDSPLDPRALAVGQLGEVRLAARDVTTAPHPGFPTDLQAQWMALATSLDGESAVTETVFENRFQHVPELVRMGARIRMEGRTATVNGPTPLSGASVMASDLRASAALILAGVAAQGETVVDRVYHLDRGYARMEEKLNALGARIERVSVATGERPVPGYVRETP